MCMFTSKFGHLQTQDPIPDNVYTVYIPNYLQHVTIRNIKDSKRDVNLILYLINSVSKQHIICFQISKYGYDCIFFYSVGSCTYVSSGVWNRLKVSCNILSSSKENVFKGIRH